MASFVDICNQALSHLGDSATVASIDPPEGSAQAEHCARFLPLALATMLEMHEWSFATRRMMLAEVVNPTTTWAFAYAKPSDALQVLAILDPLGTDDQSNSAGYTPRDFVVETDALGNEIILTHQADAVARCAMNVQDPAKFTPMFTEALGWLLASKLAGPVIKGETGMQAGQAAAKTFKAWFDVAAASDANQSEKTVTQHVSWIDAR